MRVTRLLRCACAVVVAWRLIAGVPPASAQTPIGPHSFTVTAHTYSVMDGPANNHLETLDTDLYVPDNASSATPQPAMLLTHGFGLSKSATEMTSAASYFARHGYVVLVYSSSGFGHSGGCIELDSMDWDVKDARGLIDQGLSPRADVLHDARGPVIGMMGGSYGGGIDMLVAEADSRIRAIAPFRTWDALQYSLAPNNQGNAFDLEAPTDGVPKTQWTSLLFADGLSQPVSQNGGCNSPLNATCPGFDPIMCQAYLSTAAQGGLTPSVRALLARSSPATFIDQLHIPTLLVQGESDTLFNLDEAVATYQALKARGTPVHMIWHSGGHGGYNSMPGEGDFFAGDTTNPDADFLPQQTLAWMEHWLRGSAVPLAPEFQYFRDWVTYDHNNSAAPAYGAAPSFPVGDSSRFALSTGGAMSRLPGPPPAHGSAVMLAPAGGVPASYSETSNFQAPGSTLPGGAPSPYTGIPPSDPPLESLAFTSAPFARDTTSVGVPTAHLHLAHVNGQDVFLFGKVYDVAPDGTATLIHRLIAPVRVPASQLTVSDVVDMKLLGFAHTFIAGHAVRFEVATTDATSTSSRIADEITLATGGPDPAFFSLPTSA